MNDGFILKTEMTPIKLRRCVRFMSRETFETQAPTKRSVFISINTPGYPLAKPKGSRWYGGLVWLKNDNSRPIPKNEVDLILQFVETWQNYDFIVHCDAGISRSAAVAQYIGARLDRKVVGVDSDGEHANAVIKSALMRRLKRQ